MKLKNLSRWTLSEAVRGLLFFSQRVDELLFDFSLDTHKPPALNAPFLCIEAIDLIKEIDKGFMEPSNLEPVLDELAWSLQNDQVAKTLLDTDPSYYTLKNEETPLSQTRLRLEVLGRTINPNRYLDASFTYLEEAVRACKKCDIDLLTTSIITTLLNIGVSKQWLFSLVNSHFFDPNGPRIESCDILRSFLTALAPKTHRFTGFAVVSDLIKQVAGSVQAFGIVLIEKLPDALGIDWTAAVEANEVVVRVDKIDAPDPYNARDTMFKRLDALSDLFTLFYHREHIGWRDEAIILQECCAKTVTRPALPKGPMEKAFDLNPARASKHLNALLKNFSARRDAGSMQRFKRVVDLHSVCVTHKIVDNQLVNLWIALETLVPSHVGGSKISKVIHSIMPFVLLAYIRRLMTQLLHDLLMWDKWRTRKLLAKVPVNRGSTLLERLTALIAGTDCVDLRVELYERLGDFELLRYRCFRLAEKLESKQKVFELLERHEKKVAWQVRRLYRARNLIVHTSKSPSYLETLVTNGHDYLDQVTFDVIRVCSGGYKTRTIEQAFELGAIFYRKYKLNISAFDTFSATNSLVLSHSPAGFITDVEGELGV